MTVMQPEDHRAPDFTYRFKSGKSVTLPRFQSVMTFGLARRLRKFSEDEQMFALVEDVCDESALAVLDEMDTNETLEFFDAWQKDSGVSVGESSA